MNWEQMSSRLAAQAASTPDAVALRWDGEEIRHRDLEEMAERTARLLRGSGLAPGALVALYPGPAAPGALLGIWRAGCACLPLDPAAPRQRLETVLAASGAAWLRHDGDLRLDAGSGGAHASPADTDRPRLILYESDPAGRPVGAVLSEEGLVNALDFCLETLKIDFRQAVVHQDVAGPFGLPLWLCALLAGGTATLASLASDTEAALEPGTTSLALPLAALAAVAGEGEEAWVARLAGAGVRNLVTVGEEPVRVAGLKQRLQQAGIRWHNLFGFPHVHLVTTVTEVDGTPRHRGRPMVGTRVFLLNPALEPVAAGLPGELFVAGSGRAAGYWCEPELAAERWVESPLAPGQKLLRTGVQAIFREGGLIEVAGRCDGRFMAGGRRLALAEIELALRRDPTVEDCVVVRRFDADGERTIAYVLPRTTPFRPPVLERRLRDSLPAAAFPLGFVEVSGLPRTPAGSTDLRQLAKPGFLDTLQLAQLGEAVRHASGAGEVAVLTELWPEAPPRLYLKDFLPARSFAGRPAGTPLPPASEPWVGPPAQSRGLPLDAEPDAWLGDLLEQAAASGTGGVAFLHRDGSETSLSYPALLERARRVAGGLGRHGFTVGTRVLFQLDDNEEFLVAFWGCVLAALVPVPLTVPPTFREETNAGRALANVWRMLGDPPIIAGGALRQPVKELLAEGSGVAPEILTMAELADSEPKEDVARPDPDSLALLLFTSGSTGRPKGVTQTHRSLVSHSRADSLHNGFSAADVSLNWMPLEHVGGLVMFHLRDICVACRQAHARTVDILEDPLRWLDWIERQRATITWAPNFAFALVNDRAAEVACRSWDLSSLGFILNGGEAINAATAARFLTLLAPHGLPATAMRPAWGMSETCSGVTYSTLFAPDGVSGVHRVSPPALGQSVRAADLDAEAVSFVEVGVPIPGFAMRIVDAEDRLLPERVVGRLQVQGPSVTRGYLDNPEMNQQTFTSDGWMTTGDLGFLDAGRLTIAGREKGVIIINGVNYHDHEIEAVVQSVDGVEVSFAAACAVREPGLDTDRLAVFFASRSADFEAQLEQIRQIRSRVTERVGVNPHYVVPVARESFPKTSIGKIQRAELGKRLEEGRFGDILRRIEIALTEDATLPDWFFARVWVRRVRPSMEVERRGLTLLLAAGEGLAEPLAAGLAARGERCVRVHEGANGEEGREHFSRLVERIEAEHGPIERVIDLGGCDPAAGVARTVYTPLFLVQALAGLGSQERELVFVSLRALAAGGRIDPAKGAASGLLKSLALELPWLRCRHIDLDSPEAGPLLAELAVVGGEPEVAYRDGQRLVPLLRTVAQAEKTAPELPLVAGGLYLVTGGLGGIGAHVCRWLVRETGARLLVVGRTPLPERARWEDWLQEEPRSLTAQRIRSWLSVDEGGGELCYAAGDVADAAFLARAVAESEERLGVPLSGIFHLAGTLEGAAAGGKSHWEALDEHWAVAERRESIAAVLRPKVDGALALAGLLGSRPMASFVAFSSVNALFGGATLAAYAAANSFLETFTVHLRRDLGRQAWCLSWSLWEDIGMTLQIPPAMRAGSQAGGYQPVSAREGIDSLRIALLTGGELTYIGLDPVHPKIRRLLREPLREIQKIEVFCTPDRNEPDRNEEDQGRLREIAASAAARIGGSAARIEVAVHTVGALPRNASGEIDIEALEGWRAELREGSTGSPPQLTPTEERIAAIWRDLLGRRHIDRQDNFFSLGGHSLLAGRLMARLRQELGIDLPLRTLFEAPTLAELAGEVEAAGGAPAGEPAGPPAIAPAPRTGPLPASFAQQRLWLLQRMAPESPFYNIPAAFHLEGRLDEEALAQSLSAIVARHEVLRTSFPEAEGQPVQEIASAAPVAITRIDLTGFTPARAAEEGRLLALTEARRPFDLARGPLLRATLVRLTPERHLLLLTLHHIVADGWSVGVFLREWQALYAAFARGAEAALPPLPVQYGDFSVWQRRWLAEGALASQLDYWRRRLDGCPPPLRLPADRPRPAERRYLGDRRTALLPPALADALAVFAERSGGTLFMTLLAGLQVLLWRQTGERDLIVGSPVANRARPELEGLIGFFSNTLPLRATLAAGDPWSAHFARVRSHVLEDFGHQDVPFDVLVEELAPEREGGSAPFFEVMLVLQNASQARLEFAGLEVSLTSPETATSRFELALSVEASAAGLKATAEYDTDLFDGERIERLLGQLRTLLEAAVATPQCRIVDLPLLSAGERSQALAAWRDLAGERAEFASQPAAADPALWESLAPDLLSGHPVVPGCALPAVFESPGGGGRGVLLVLEETLEPSPLGVDGEIYAWLPGGRLLPTGDRGRRRGDGTVELTGSRERRIWTGAARLDCERIERALLSEGSVVDCAVGVREAETGPEAVAYVVGRGAFQPERLREHLLGRLPAAQVPRAFVEVARLPLLPSGRLDERALAGVELAGDDLAAKWEERLRELPGVAEAVAVVSEVEPRLPALHLADLLPGWQRLGSPASAAGGGEPAAAGETPAAAAPARGPALSWGGELVLGAEAPASLGETLRRAAALGDEHGILYLGPGGQEERQSYRALLTEAREVLAGLQDLGLVAGDPVLFQLAAARDYLPVFWACALGGMVPVPVSPAPSYDPDNGTVQKLLNAWRMLDHPLIVGDAAATAAIRSLARSLGLNGLRVEEAAALRREPAGTNPEVDPDVDPDQPALFLLTSGSTGLPKVVVQTHRAILSRSAATAQRNGFSFRDVSLNWFPLDHVGGIVMFHLRDVYLGCRQIQAPTQLVLEEPLLWLDWIDRYRATITWAPNFAFGLVNDRAEEIAGRSWDLSSMRFILNGGEAIVARTARRFLALLAPHGLPADAMHPAWGMSETCSGVAYSERFSLPTTRDEDPFVEVGRPLPGVWLRIVGAPGVVVEEGQIGSLEIKGPMVTRGYHRNPELNSEVFDDGWFRTGDLGFLADGRLTITGREKDVIIINGVNHYCHEIEAVAEEVPGIEVSFTAACAVRAAGDDTDRLAVFFSPAEGEASAELLERLRSALVTRGGINPSYLLPVSREAIPKTAIGKIQRAELRRRFEAGELAGVLQTVDLLAENANTLPDWFFRRVWRRREPVRGGDASGRGRTLLFADRRGLAAALLPRLGDDAVVVEEGGEFSHLGAGRYTLDPAAPDHYRRLLAELAAAGPLPSRILHLWVYDLSGAAITEPGDLEEAQRRSVFSLLFLLQALAPFQAEAAGSLELWVVSGRAQPVQPGEEIAYGAATLPGFLKTVALEMGGIRCCHVDLEGTATSAEAQELWRELASGDRVPEVAYRGGHRLVPCLVNAELPRVPAGSAGEVPIETGGTYLVTGGLGGIGTVLVRLLVERYRARVLLVGRTLLPPRAEWPQRSQETTVTGARLRALMALEALGGEVAYETVDVGDLAALREAVGAAEAKWGRPLAGVFHLAGVGGLERHWQVAAEHRLEVESPATFHDMFRPKVQGTWSLFRLLADRPGALFVAFSSVTAVFGGATFVAYAAANSFLDACCFHHRGHGLPRVFCFNWSQWDEIGMSRGNPAAAREAAALLGLRLVSGEQGLQSLLSGLAGEPGGLIVGLDGASRSIRREMAGGPLEVRGVTAWVVPAAGGFDPSAVEALEVVDRYGRRSACAVQLLDRLPRLESGEVDRSRLAARAIHGPAGPRRTSPRSEVERQIAEIWRDLLRVGEVGVEESFFALGGHSLLATQLVARLQKTFKVEVSLRSLFEEPTIAGLARRLLESETEPGQLEATARLRRRIAAMSADEAQELLRRAAQPGMAR